MISILEDKTQFCPGKVIYTLKIELPKQDAQTIEVSRDTIFNKIIFPKEVPDGLRYLIVREIRSYIAAITVQGDY